MAVTIGINGFGRIGRYLTRLLAGDDGLRLVAVNDLMPSDEAAHLLKYDSVHGRFPDVEPSKDGFLLAGSPVRVTNSQGGEWDWCDCDIVVETTGLFTDRKNCLMHRDRGARKVIIGQPSDDADITVVMGVNDQDLRPEHSIISNASCTTNCLALPAMHIQEAFGIRHGYMTTVHPYTMRQRLLDGSHPDWRRARACAVNTVPTTTRATQTVGKVIPALEGRLDSLALRVPVASVSYIDLICTLEKPTTREEVNELLKGAANEYMGYTEEPLVSSDFIGDTHGSVVDGTLTAVMNGDMLKVIAWYDNEASFTNQLLRLVRRVASMM